MAFEEIDISDIEASGEMPASAFWSVSIQDIDLSDLFGPASTGEQRAQDIWRTAGFNPQGFGDSVVERLGADLFKGAATSLPGRLAGRAIGAGETVEQLKQLPTAQPIPYLPDFDTLGQFGADAVAFSLLTPAAAIPGAAVGRFAAARLPVVQTLLKAPSVVQGELAKKVTRELVKANTKLFEAAGAGTATGATLGGAELAAGGDRSTAAIVGALSGVAAAARPFFQAARLATHASKLGSKRYVEAERGVAEMLDTMIAKPYLAGPNGANLTPAQAAKAAADDLRLGWGDQIEGYIAASGTEKGFLGNLDKVRELIPDWEDVVLSNRVGLLETKAAEGGKMWSKVYRAYGGLFQSSQRTLQRLGPEGTRIAQRIEGALNKTDVSFSHYLEKAKVFVQRRRGKYDISDDGLIRAVDAIESGQAATLRGTKLEPLIDVLEQAKKDVAASGIEMGTLKNYFPHSWDWDSLERWIRNPSNQDKLAKTLGVPENQKTMLIDRTLRAIRDNKKPGVALRSSIDFSRELKITHKQARELGMPLAHPRAALRRYLGQVSERRAFAEAFGAENQVLDEMLDQVALKHGSAVGEFVRSTIRQSIGLADPAGDLTNLFGWFQSNVVVPSKLSLAVVSNMGQSVNTAAKVGVRNTFKAMRDVRRELKAFKRAGGTESDFFRQMRLMMEEIQGATEDLLTGGRGDTLFRPVSLAESGRIARLNLGSFFLRATGFNAVERFNRLTAAYAGRHWLDDMVRKATDGGLSPRRMAAVRRDFAKLGLSLDDAIWRGGLTVDEQFRAALKLSDVTQFRVRPFDLPTFWSHPNASLFRMLKTFSFNQARFVKDSIMKPALRGEDFRPAAFFLTGFPSVGAGVGAVRTAMKGRDPFAGEDSLPAQYVAAMGWVGGVGFLGDFIRGVAGGERTLIELAIGPTLSEAIEGVGALASTVRKGSPEPFLKWQLRQTPFVAQDLFGSRGSLEQFFGLNAKGGK